MSESNILWHLENFNMFHQLDANSLSELSKRANIQKFSKSQLIFNPNDKHHNIYFLKSGKVKISTFNESKEELIKVILNEGDMFGKLPFAPGSEKNDHAYALDNCTVCFLPSNDFEQIVQENIILNNEVIKLIGKRIQKLERRLEGLSFKDAKTRLIEMIFDFNEDYGNRVGNEYFIDQNLSHRELAALISTSRQTVTKLLNELKDKKLIDFNRKKLIIRNIDGLKSEIMDFAM